MMRWLKKMLGRKPKQTKEVIREDPPDVRMLESREFGVLFLLYEHGMQTYPQMAEWTYYQLSLKMIDKLMEERLITTEKGQGPLEGPPEYALSAFGATALAHYNLSRWIDGDTPDKDYGEKEEEEDVEDDHDEDSLEECEDPLEECEEINCDEGADQ